MDGGGLESWIRYSRVLLFLHLAGRTIKRRYKYGFRYAYRRSSGTECPQSHTEQSTVSTWDALVRYAKGRGEDAASESDLLLVKRASWAWLARENLALFNKTTKKGERVSVSTMNRRDVEEMWKKRGFKAIAILLKAVLIYAQNRVLLFVICEKT